MTQNFKNGIKKEKNKMTKIIKGKIKRIYGQNYKYSSLEKSKTTGYGKKLFF